MKPLCALKEMGNLLRHGVVLQGVWYLVALVPLWIDSQTGGCDVLLSYVV